MEAMKLTAEEVALVARRHRLFALQEFPETLTFTRVNERGMAEGTRLQERLIRIVQACNLLLKTDIDCFHVVSSLLFKPLALDRPFSTVSCCSCDIRGALRLDERHLGLTSLFDSVVFGDTGFPSIPVSTEAAPAPAGTEAAPAATVAATAS